MKQLRLCLSLLLGLCLFLPARIAAADTAADSPSLIISEIKIKNDTAANGYNEFIELYNTDVTSLNLNNFTIEYFNSPAPGAGDQPVKKVIIADGLLLPTQTIVLAANKQQIPNSLDSPFSSLSDTGGLVRLRSLDGTIQDQVAWTSTSALAISPVLFLSTSTTNRAKSFMRGSDSQGNLQLLNPVWQLLTPAPHADALLAASQPDPDPEPAEVPSPEPAPSPADTLPTDSNVPAGQDPDAAATAVLTPPQITELLPNPAAPASDSTDEFIELYNPNDQPIDLKDYRLQSGNTFSYNYIFDTASLAAHEYHAFLVTQTGDILSNTSGQARLLDPAGAVVGQTDAYESAAEGQAWALINGVWQWTATPTPSAPNVLAAEVPKVVGVVKAPTTKAPSKTAAKSTAAAKPKAAAAKSTKAAAASNRQVYQDPADAPPSIHPGILAGVGVITLLYAGYEYRYDAVNTVRRFQRYRGLRRAARTAAPGR